MACAAEEETMSNRVLLAYFTPGGNDLETIDTENVVFVTLLVLVFVVAIVLLCCTSQIAPYGRMLDEENVPSYFKYFPEVDERIGWVIMEVPSTLGFAAAYIAWTVKENEFEAVPFVLLLIWESHYFHRTFIYPFFTIRNSKKGAKMNSLVPFFGIIFNIINSYLNATFIAKRAKYPPSWFWDARFIVGVIIFYLGFYINRFSDSILRNLRNPDEDPTGSVTVTTGKIVSRPSSNAVLRIPGNPDNAPPSKPGTNGTISASFGVTENIPSNANVDVYNDKRGLQYKIPHGGLYRFVSCPNYLGETIMWTGWALASWSLAGLSFAFFTAGNLWPRAVETHKWYLKHFPNYPKKRKAVLPFIY